VHALQCLWAMRWRWFGCYRFCAFTSVYGKQRRAVCFGCQATNPINSAGVLNESSAGREFNLSSHTSSACLQKKGCVCFVFFCAAVRCVVVGCESCGENCLVVDDSCVCVCCCCCCC
jgi:hypothetical protein